MRGTISQPLGSDHDEREETAVHWSADEEGDCNASSRRRAAGSFQPAAEVTSVVLSSALVNGTLTWWRSFVCTELPLRQSECLLEMTAGGAHRRDKLGDVDRLEAPAL